MDKEKMVVQDSYLNALRKESVQVTVFTSNGFPMKGKVKSFDQFTVVVDNGTVDVLLYKHAISTLVPAKRVKYYNSEEVVPV